MAVFQLGVFPLVVKAVGLTAGQRVGFVMSALAFVAIPAGKSLCWNYSSLYTVFVVAIAAINCSLSAVSGKWWSVLCCAYRFRLSLLPFYSFSLSLKKQRARIRSVTHPYSASN